MPRPLPVRPIPIDLVDRIDLRDKESNRLIVPSLHVSATCPVYVWQRDTGTPHMYIYKHRGFSDPSITREVKDEQPVINVVSPNDNASKQTSKYEPFILIATPMALSRTRIDAADNAYIQIQASSFVTRITTGKNALIELSECEIAHTFLKTGSECAATLSHDSNCAQIRTGTKCNITATGYISRIEAFLSKKSVLSAQHTEHVILHAQRNARVKARIEQCEKLVADAFKGSRLSICLGRNVDNLTLTAVNGAIINGYGTVKDTLRTSEKYTISETKRQPNEIGFVGQVGMIEDNIGVSLVDPKASRLYYHLTPTR